MSWGRGHRGQEATIARLVLLNGPPGIGKSTLARRYALDDPLTLVVDFDEIQAGLVLRSEPADLRSEARRVGLAMTRAQLLRGRDVLVPAFCVRRSLVRELQQAAVDASAGFHEVVLVDRLERVITRFRARRAHQAAAGEPDSAPDIDPAHDAEILAWATRELEEWISTRADALRLATTIGDVEGSYRAFRLLTQDT